MTKRCLVFVHAHPDDETLATGGTIARYADAGHHVVLITCTNGEEGEIAEVPDLGTLEEIKPRLGEIRRVELEAACRVLGNIDLRMLGYHDSGMDGTPENEATHAFMNEDLDAVASRIAEICSEVGADVVVTYNAYGGYGHPDHIKAHHAAMLAAERCNIAKVYHHAFPKSLLQAGRALFGEDFFSEEEIERVGTDDALVTTSIEVTQYVKRKMDALKAHRTQLGTIAPFLAMPEELHVLALGTEHYVLARSSVPSPEGIENDLLLGL